MGSPTSATAPTLCDELDKLAELCGGSDVTSPHTDDGSEGQRRLKKLSKDILPNGEGTIKLATDLSDLWQWVTQEATGFTHTHTQFRLVDIMLTSYEHLGITNYIAHVNSTYVWIVLRTSVRV